MSALAAELDGIDLGDQRLNRRARQVLATLGIASSTMTR